MAVSRSPTRVVPNMANQPEDARRSTEDPALDATIAAATLKKLPPFWKKNPGMWFIQVESMFNIARITGDDTKYHHIIAQLDRSVLPFVADLLTSPPARGKYDAIKERLINSFDESAKAKLRRVLRSSHLGDEKPSHYLQKLRNLAGNQISEVVLRSLFLEQFPENIRSILVISNTSLANLALQADKIQEMHSVTIAAASRTPSSVSLHRDGGGSTSSMQNRIDRLAKMVEALTAVMPVNARIVGRGTNFYPLHDVPVTPLLQLFHLTQLRCPTCPCELCGFGRVRLLLSFLHYWHSKYRKEHYRNRNVLEVTEVKMQETIIIYIHSRHIVGCAIRSCASDNYWYAFWQSDPTVLCYTVLKLCLVKSMLKQCLFDIRLFPSIFYCNNQ
uniref:uncharacterized protein LOC117605194 n=1 Tax=Osmia lignaria TaxID=473952 RepID=UPI001478985A|nr:uncharacterized protein LOC117605194 [Osmia lignaria]